MHSIEELQNTFQRLEAEESEQRKNMSNMKKSKVGGSIASMTDKMKEKMRIKLHKELKDLVDVLDDMYQHMSFHQENGND